MKRHKQLWEKVASPENLLEAAQDALPGKRGKQAGAAFFQIWEKEVVRLALELDEGMRNTRKAGACAERCWDVESFRDARATNGWRVAADPRRQLEQQLRQPRVVEPQQQQPDEREQQRGVPRRRLLAGEGLRVFSGQATACGQNRGGQVPSATVSRSGTTGRSGGRVREGFPANQPPLRCGE